MDLSVVKYDAPAVLCSTLCVCVCVCVMSVAYYMKVCVCVCVCEKVVRGGKSEGTKFSF